MVLRERSLQTKWALATASVIKWVYGGRFPRPSALNKIYELTEGERERERERGDFLQQIQKINLKS